jgi:hypothetical protein
MMDELLTIEEIQARFAPDWVLIGDPLMGEDLEVRAGRVLFHGADQDEVCCEALNYPPGRYALLYLGTYPEDLVLVI